MRLKPITLLEEKQAELFDITLAIFPLFRKTMDLIKQKFLHRTGNHGQNEKTTYLKWEHLSVNDMTQ